MSFLVQLFEKADVKSMMQGMDADSIIQVLIKVMDTSETLKALSDKDKQSLIQTQHQRAVSSFDKLQRSIKEFRQATNDKEDRVVWGVRWLKIAHIFYIWTDVYRKWKVEDVDWSKQLVAQYSFVKKIKQRAPRELEDASLAFWIQPWGNADQLATNSAHYHSMNISTIEEVVYQYQAPKNLYEHFYDLEEEWKARFDSFIEWNDEDRVVKWYDNKKFAWVLLDRASCSEEGNAMGHCGNSPRSHTDDQILSFRRFIAEGDKKYWEPHLTFILMKGGKLHEMKGRNNDKPKEKYHPYIVDLLLMEDLISEIVGGGYMPENNFALSDLDDDVREKLLKKRPDMLHPLERWESSKNDPEANEIFRLYLEGKFNNIISVNDHWVLFETGSQLRDMPYHVSHSKSDFISYAQKDGMKSDTARYLFNLLTELLTNDHDHDDVVEWLAENDDVKLSRENMMTKIIQNLFKTGDRKLIKAFNRELKKIGGGMEGTQQEFDFISREEKLMAEARSVAKILIDNGYDFDTRVSEQLIIRALIEFCEGIAYSLTYGSCTPFIYDNDISNTLPINDTPIACETSFSSDDLPDLDSQSIDEQIEYVIDNSLDGTGDKPNWFGGTNNWRVENDPQYMRLLGEYIYENQFDISLIDKEWIKLAYSSLPDNLKK